MSDRGEHAGSGGRLDRGDRAPDPTAQLLRAHGRQPPYDAVEWDRLAARIAAGAGPELTRRRAMMPLGRPQFTPPVRPWWEIAAGWARPALAAAISTIVVAAALLTATAGTTSASAGQSTGQSTAATTGADGVDAVMLGGSSAATPAVDGAAMTRDSLFSTLVNAQ